MKILGICGAFLLLLSGCGLVLGPMVDRMDATKDKVAATDEKMSRMLGKMDLTNDLLLTSNHNMTEMERVQTLGGATAIAVDKGNALAIRVRAAQVMFIVANVNEKDDQLYEYLGAPAPLLFEAVDLPDLGATRNVTIVGDKITPGRVIIPPVNEEMYQIYVAAIRKMLQKLAAAVQDPNQDKKVLRERAERALYVSTTILGSAPSVEAARYETEGGQVAKFKENAEIRKQAAETLRRLHGALALEDKVPAATMEAQIETKLFGSKPAH